MRRALTTLVLATALFGALPACTLVWEPVVFDAATIPDAGMDGWAPDADVDAARTPDAGTDAFVAPDAWAPPREICAVPNGSGTERLEGMDNDGDGLVDCDDPDCYGQAICCSDRVGRDLDGDFSATEPPIGWTRTNTSLSSGTTGFVALDFGTLGGNVRRRSCVPLAAGARLSVDLRRGGGGSGDLSLVLSPAASPTPSGFLDELALRFEASSGRFQVTRAGIPIALTSLSGTDCASAQTSPTAYDIDLPTRLVMDVRPGVTGGVSALLVTVEVFFDAAGGSCSSVRPVVEVPIEVRDLIHTSDGSSDSCDESPGLYVAIEGHGDAYEIGTHLTLRRFECASPAVFSVVRDVVERVDLASSIPTLDVDFAAGGIGAPDLDYVAGEWHLTYDASHEDRSGEIFQPLTMRIGESLSPNLLAWRGVPADDGTPVRGTPSSAPAVREPTGLFDLTDVMVFAVERGSATPRTGAFDLYRAGTSVSGEGNWELPASPVVADASLLPCSFREPALAHADGGNHWLLARCDDGTDSTLVALRIPETGAVTVVSSDLLADIAPDIANHVRAVDVATSSPAPGGDRYFAVWVLAEVDGARTLHLFAGEAPDRTFPSLHPYAGNPVLVDDDLRDGCTGACEITSFGVGLEGGVGPDVLQFLFARSRAETGGSVHELIRRSQFAPGALNDSR